MKPTRNINGFNDTAAVANYADGPKRLVPGFADMQRMAMLLLAERAPNDANILVLGAGGGLELKVFAQAQTNWRFLGVDPSQEMLNLAQLTLGDLVSRVQFQLGYIDDAPTEPFDAACCLLTLHFLDKTERLRTLKEIHKRLKPGSPFVAAHHSIAQADLAIWLSRFAAFAISSGVDPDKALTASKGLATQLPILSPEEDLALLHEAGFKDAALFYAAFTFRGWVAHA